MAATRHIALLGLLAVLGGSCASSPNFEGKDSGVLFPTVRLRVPLSEPDEPHVEGEEPSSVSRRVVGLEAGYTTGEGDFDATEFDLAQVHAAAFFSTQREQFTLDWLLGLGWESIDIEDTASIIGPVHEAELGLFFGLQVLAPVAGAVDLFLRTELTLAPLGTESLQLEAGLHWTLLDGVQLLAGYRRWNFEQEGLDFFGATTDIDVTATGPVLGLTFSL